MGENVANGLNLSGFTLPEDVMELILSKLSDKDVLKCNFVCHKWKDLVVRKSFWKLRFKNKGVHWSDIANNIKRKPNAWAVFHSHLCHRILSKNYIGNPSGQDGLLGWDSFGSGKWAIEPKAMFCDTLPDSVFFEKEGQSCFVITNDEGSKSYSIDLSREGLTPEILKMMIPFELKCSQLYTASCCTAALFDWELRLSNSNCVVRSYSPDPIKIIPGGKWQKVEYSFKFGSTVEDLEDLKDLRSIQFTHGARNDPTRNQIDHDHYEVKFARACVTLDVLAKEPDA